MAKPIMIRTKSSVAGLRCLRCDALYPPDHFVADCPACRAVAPSNLVVEYRGDVLDGVTKQSLASGPRSIWRYAHSLPVAAEHGGFAGRGLDAAGRAAASRASNWALAACMPNASSPIRPARSRTGWPRSPSRPAARCSAPRVIASSSSGNAGAAAAAYAARAGLPCIVFTFLGTAGPMVTQMQAYGAMVVGVEDKAHRWTLLEAGVRRFGWFPTSPFFGPVVGSNPYGIEGYKSLAYEIAEQLGWRVPDWVVLPVCYGDALVGMARGFAELVRLNWIERMPRLVAAEIYGSLSQAEQERRDDPPSIPRSYDTVADLDRRAAEHVPGAESGARDRAARPYACRTTRSCIGTAKSRARRGCSWSRPPRPRSPRSTCCGGRARSARPTAVTCLITAGGLKDPAVAAKSVAPIPKVPPDLDRVLDVVQQVYGVDARQLSNRQGE